MRALLHSLTGILCAMLLLAGMGLADGGLFHCGGHHHHSHPHHELDRATGAKPTTDLTGSHGNLLAWAEPDSPDCCDSGEMDPSLTETGSGLSSVSGAPICGICDAPDDHSHPQFSWEMLPLHQTGIPAPVWLVFTAFPHPEEVSRAAQRQLEDFRERSPECVPASPPPHLRCAPLLI